MRTATATEIRNYADLLNDAETAFQGSRVNYVSILSPNLKNSNAQSAKFLGDAKKPISCVLGNQWNSHYVEAGFLQDLTIPRRIDARIALLDRLAIYLAAHPECEAAKQNITAARARELHTTLTTANRAIGHYETDHKALRIARDTAKKELHNLVSDVVAEVRRKLKADSTLWSSFGLTAPKPRAPRPKKPKAPKAAKTDSKNGTETVSTPRPVSAPALVA